MSRLIGIWLKYLFYGIIVCGVIYANVLMSVFLKSKNAGQVRRDLPEEGFQNENAKLTTEHARSDRKYLSEVNPKVTTEHTIIRPTSMASPASGKTPIETTEYLTATPIYSVSTVKETTTTDLNPWEKKINGYLRGHQERCTEFESRNVLPIGKRWCSCIPPALGYRGVSFDAAPLNETEAANPEVRDGGHWQPSNCIARTRVAVIIPFRNRSHHLEILLKHLHPILKSQMINYTIVVVEQSKPRVFNKAALMNIGYKYVKGNVQSDCVIFHDVDHVPEDARHFYVCREEPLHLGAFHSGHDYKLIYQGIFGAVTAFRSTTFEKINGFSNRFFGWGGEDDDMAYRIKEHHLHLGRDPREVAGYKVMIHSRDKGNINPNRKKMLNILFHDRDGVHDGLSSLKFNISKIVKYRLYTWVLTNVLNRQ